MRVWFNRWFSTVYHLIQLIKDGSPEKFTFVGSSTNPKAIYKEICDEWYLEPDIPVTEEYIKFCLTFCKEHNIDIFFPRYGLTLLSHFREKFKEEGIIIACGSEPAIMDVLDDKVATYDFFKKRDPSLLPDYRVVSSYKEFVASYEGLKQNYERVCYKLVKDEGAMTFRVIDDSIIASGNIYRKPGLKVTWSMANTIMRGYDFHVPIILMPYLEGQEISVDCLRTKTGDIIIPRFKTNHRYSEIYYDKYIMKKCQEIIDWLKITVPINIQFRSDKNKYYLLEINPRMSGGLQLSCLASKINIPNIAINQLIGIYKKWQYPKTSDICCVANIETPLYLH